MPPELLLVWVMLALGYGAARLGALPAAAEVLNRFVVTVSLPALVLRVVPGLRFAPDLWVLCVTPWVLLGVSVVLVLGLSRALGLRRDVTAALLLTVPLGNTSFLGFPLVSALLGPRSVAMAALYDQFGSFLALSTYGLVVVARFSGGEAPGALRVLRNLVRFPPFVALLLALLPLPHPALVELVLGRLADTLVPLAMFAVGLTVRIRPPKERAALASGLALKMLLLPALAYGFARSVGAAPSVLRVTVLEAGMPPMITAGALALLHGFAPELSAALVGYGILLASITAPALAFLLG